MDRIRTLCRGQNREATRRILAAYYLGIADALKSPSRLPKVDTRQLPDFLKRQAE